MATAAETRYSASSAVISADGRYRYVLHRRWDGGGGKVLTFIGLNPSTAGADADDPTIRRMCGFARRERATGICVLNLFALRSPQPAHLRMDADPAGPENDGWIARLAGAYGPVIAAWGASPAAAARVPRVLELLAGRPMMCFGVTASGAPRHPLYLRADAPLVSYGDPS